MMEQESHPTFEQLETLAYLENDRFCEKCAYNLRGQPVRREPATQLLLCRCPECGSYAPANHVSPALNAWVRRLAMLLWGVWLIVCLYLLVGVAGAMVACMVGVSDELEHLSSRRYRDFSIPAPDAQDMQRHEKNLESKRTLVRALGLAGMTAIGLVGGMIWPVLFPHWRRWGCFVLAITYPLIAGAALLCLSWTGELKPPDDAATVWTLALMPVLAIAGGLVGALLGRPTTRLALSILLTPRPRAAFGYLWMVDGHKPPSAK